LSTTTNNDLPTAMVAALGREIEGAGLQAAAGLDDPVKVYMGFPFDEDPFHLPAVSLDESTPDWTYHAPIEVAQKPGSGPDTTLWTFEVGEVDLMLQADIWTSSKTQRMALLPKLRALFEPDVDSDGSISHAGLELDLPPEFYGARARWHLEDADDNDAEGRTEELYRRTWKLQGHADLRRRQELEDASFDTNLTFQ